MKKDNDIEDLFKDKFENFEAEVSPSVWDNVKTALKGFGLGFLVKTLINKIGTNTLIAVVSSAATVISTVMVMNWGSTTKDNEPVENKTTTLAAVEKPAVVINEPVIINKEGPKTTITAPIAPAENKKAAVEPPTKSETVTVKTDDKEMAAVINKFSKKPVADIFASPVAGTVPLIVSLMNNGTGKENKWTFGDTKVLETETSPVHIYNEPGIYTVKLISTDVNGKATMDSVKIEVMGNSSISSVPTNFSRTKLPMYLCEAKYVKNTTATIVDKKGNTVFQSGDKWDGKWDGNNLKGEAAKEGIYFFIINAEGVDGKKYEQKGSINLTR
ncbi:MAG: gliding motility-associated C-terminal domain-containing protein [Bacteroidetes bacterium]|nr:gliding motility-associated C-terminal domain-containing protein [Bacteroidota bacterium]